MRNNSDVITIIIIIIIIWCSFEVTGEQLYALYSSSNIIRVINSRRMGWVGYVTRMGDRKGAYRVLMGKPDGKRPFARPRRRRNDNTKMYVQQLGWRSTDWIALAQDKDRWGALVNAGNFLTR
jgi:hypothetical protein